MIEIVRFTRAAAPLASTRTIRPVRHVAVGTVHDVLNRAPEPATSLHVYSPPLSSMSWYDPPAPAALGREGPPAGSYPLHPAGRRARP